MGVRRWGQAGASEGKWVEHEARSEVVVVSERCFGEAVGGVKWLDEVRSRGFNLHRE
jgi:hypothetical protein